MASRKAPWGADLSPGMVAGQRAGQAKVTGSSEPDKGDPTADKAVPSRGKALSERDTRLLIGVDGRTPWARRARTIMAAFVSDLGGASAVSAAERALCRRAAVLVVQLEQIEARMAEGTATHVDTDLYGRGTGHLRRVLVDLGLKRVPRDVTPRKKHGMSEALYDLYVAEGKITPSEDDNE